METLEFHLRDHNPGMVASWRDMFDGVEGVTVSQGDIFGVRADAVISPANSFGYMDGGIDLVYAEYFGWDVERRLQAKLQDEHDGELPVGQAVIIETNHAEIPYMVSAPTMRIPQSIVGTLNAYLAFRAAIRAVKAFNREKPGAIKTILCPGLGTAVGRMPHRHAAQQMLAAYLIAAQGRRDFSNLAYKVLYNHGALINAEPLWSDQWSPRR